MIAYCPRCGTDFGEDFKGEWFETALRCRDCGLTVGAQPAMLARGPEDDEVEYDLVDWPTAERGGATAAFLEAEIPYRWEAELVLVVPTVAEEEVDRLLDQLEEAGELAPADEGEDADADAGGGEEAQAAMADLFVAADRLQHAPADVDVATEVVAAASVVRESAPPYGIERPVWRRIQELASALVGDIEEFAPEDVVAANAQAVRDFLRDYV